jgi:hypothetical protein
MQDMNAAHFGTIKTGCLLALLGALGTWQLQADVRIRVSVKAILGPTNQWPNNPGGTIGTTGVNLNSETAIRDNIDLANGLLSARGSSFRFVLRNDTVYTVSGQDNPWYSINARNAQNKSDLEETAKADKATWKWHDDSINIYLNDTASGWCSSPGNGEVIFIGAGAYQELIIHEIGHFLNLGHTHPADDDGGVDDWGDGDGFSETLSDDKDASAMQINTQYPGQSQATRDNLIFNIMSYHQPQDRFVWQQREAMIATYNISRAYVASGRTRFVQSGASPNLWFPFHGLIASLPYPELQEAIDQSTSSDDVILIRGSTHDVTDGMVIAKPLTLRAWRGSVSIK